MHKDNNRTDRTWPLPNRSHLMRMSWHDLLFAHWPVDPADIQAHLPDGLMVDTWDGLAWLGVVPFRMTNVSPRFVPAIPGMAAFPELNVRTYVTRDDKPGVWFFSLDATNSVAVRVARVAFHLPYMDAQMTIRRQGNWYVYQSSRTHRGEPPSEFMGRYRPTGDVFFAEPGTFEFWLTARYCLYAFNGKDKIFRGEIDHPPWPLQVAELETETNTYLSSFGVDTDCPPHLIFSKEIHVRAWSNERIS